jgi:hypothetical protein
VGTEIHYRSLSDGVIAYGIWSKVAGVGFFMGKIDPDGHIYKGRAGRYHDHDQYAATSG